LILNLLEADCPIDESVYPNTTGTLRFCDSESSWDTEADTLQGSGETTSQGEGIYEVER